MARDADRSVCVQSADSDCPGARLFRRVQRRRFQAMLFYLRVKELPADPELPGGFRAIAAGTTERAIEHELFQPRDRFGQGQGEESFE